MEKIIKYLKSFGLSDAEISKVLKDVPADPAGLMGTKVSKGIFEKGGKKEMAEHPLFSEELKNPFLTDTYKGKTRDETIDLAEKGVKFLDDELTKASDLILNKNLSLSPGQRETFLRNLQMKRNFEKDLENIKSQPSAPVVDIRTRKQVETKEAEPEFDLTGILQEAGKGQLSLARLHNEGLVRATARQILYEDIKSGKVIGMNLDDLSKVKDPIENFRSIYGEGALEQLDSLTPDFNRLTSPQEASALARKKYTFEPRDEPVKESMTYDELGNLIKKGTEEPEPKSKGGRI